MALVTTACIAWASLSILAIVGLVVDRERARRLRPIPIRENGRWQRDLGDAPRPVALLSTSAPDHD
jgi:hypothetical protein